jgi:hypothetical protein
MIYSDNVHVVRKNIVIVLKESVFSNPYTQGTQRHPELS